MALLIQALSAAASLQGLYTTASGQLSILDNVTAASVPVGPPLSEQGFDAPGNCTAVAIDQTRKLHYTLARNSSIAAAGWSLVGVFLESGLVRSVQPLPEGFSLADRCDHTLNVDEEDRVLVSALTLRGATGASLTLIRISPDHGQLEVLADGMPTSLLPAEGAKPSSAFHDLTDTLWLALGTRAVGFSVLNASLSAALSAVPQTMRGLGLDVRGAPADSTALLHGRTASSNARALPACTFRLFAQASASSPSSAAPTASRSAHSTRRPLRPQSRRSRASRREHSPPPSPTPARSRWCRREEDEHRTGTRVDSCVA